MQAFDAGTARQRTYPHSAGQPARVQRALMQASYAQVIAVSHRRWLGASARVARFLLALESLLLLIPLAHAGTPPTSRVVSPGSSASTAPAAVALSRCGLFFDTNAHFQARLLGDGRLEVRWRESNREITTELRFDCGPVPYETRMREAGFRADGQTASGDSGHPVKRNRPSWSGVAAESLHQTVCRSVVGKARRGAASFFVEFCLSEADHRQSAASFALIDHQLRFER